MVAFPVKTLRFFVECSLDDDKSASDMAVQETNLK